MDNKKLIWVLGIVMIVLLTFLFNFLGYFYSRWWLVFDGVLFVAMIVFGVLKFLKYREGQSVEEEKEEKVFDKDEVLKDVKPVLEKHLVEFFSDHLDKILNYNLETIGEEGKTLTPIFTVVFKRYYDSGIHFFLINLKERSKKSLFGFSELEKENEKEVIDFIQKKKRALAENPPVDVEEEIEESYDKFTGRPKRVIRRKPKKESVLVKDEKEQEIIEDDGGEKE